MTAAAVPKSSTMESTRARSRHWVRYRSNPLAVIALGIVAFMILLAVMGPLLTPFDPNEQDLLNRLTGPSSDHWLGTDEFGRDQLSRLMVGARPSLIGASEAVAIALLVGVPLGVVAGFFGGRVDNVLSRFNDAIMSVPSLIFAITIAAVLGPGLAKVMLAVGLVFVSRVFRIARAATADVRSETFIEASDAIGCSRSRTLAAHVMPNILSPLVIQAASLLGIAVAAEASLSYIGLGVRSPNASWGNMIADAAPQAERAPYLMYPPGIMVSLLVVAFALIGDGLRAAVGIPRQSQEAL